MAEIWPWEGIALNPQKPLKLRKKEGKITVSSERDERNYEEVWRLRSEVISEEWRRCP